MPLFLNFRGLSDYVFDNYFGELLTVTVFATIAFATFLLEYDYLVALYEGFGNFTHNFGAFNNRCAYFYLAVIVHEQNFFEFYGVTGFYLVAEVVNIQEAVLFSFELLTLNFYDNVHYNIEL